MPYKKMKGLGQVSKKELDVLKKAKPKVAMPRHKAGQGLGQLSLKEMNMIKRARKNKK